MSNPIVYLAVVAAAFLLAGLVKGVTDLALPTVGIGLLSLAVPPAHAAALIVVPALITERLANDERAWSLETGATALADAIGDMSWDLFGQAILAASYWRVGTRQFAHNEAAAFEQLLRRPLRVGHRITAKA